MEILEVTGTNPLEDFLLFLAKNCQHMSWCDFYQLPGYNGNASLMGKKSDIHVLKMEFRSSVLFLQKNSSSLDLSINCRIGKHGISITVSPFLLSNITKSAYKMDIEKDADSKGFSSPYKEVLRLHKEILSNALKDRNQEFLGHDVINIDLPDNRIGSMAKVEIYRTVSDIYLGSYHIKYKFFKEEKGTIYWGDEQESYTTYVPKEFDMYIPWLCIKEYPLLDKVFGKDLVCQETNVENTLQLLLTEIKDVNGGSELEKLATYYYLEGKIRDNRKKVVKNKI